MNSGIRLLAAVLMVGAGMAGIHYGIDDSGWVLAAGLIAFTLGLFD